MLDTKNIETNITTKTGGVKAGDRLLMKIMSDAPIAAFPSLGQGKNDCEK